MAVITNPEPNILALQGEIDLHESPLVKERLLKMLEKKPARVFVDLSGVTYIDSSGLATLIEAMQRVQTYGGKLALYGIRENVRNIFHIARLDQVFRIFSDKDTAEKVLT
jgi:anti-sigma B factor antagonist